MAPSSKSGEIKLRRQKSTRLGATSGERGFGTRARMYDRRPSRVRVASIEGEVISARAEAAELGVTQLGGGGGPGVFFFGGGSTGAATMASAR